MACCSPSYACCSYDWMIPCCMPTTPPHTDDWMWRSMIQICGKDERDQLKQSQLNHGCDANLPCVQQKDEAKFKNQHRRLACNPMAGKPVIESRRMEIPFVDFKDCESFVFCDGKHTLYTQPPKVVKPGMQCIDPANGDLRAYAEHQEFEIKPNEQEYDWYRKHTVGPLTIYTPVDICVLPQKIDCPDDDVAGTEHHLLIKRPKGVPPTTFQGLFEPNPRKTAKFVPGKKKIP